MLRARRRRASRALRATCCRVSSSSLLALRERLRACRASCSSNCARSLAGLLAVGRDARAVGLALVRFELGALATRERVALAFFGDRHLAANLLDLLALRRHEAQQLGALRFGRGAIAVRGVARLLAPRTTASSACGALSRSVAHALVESLQLVVPRFHLALGERDLDREAARRELGVSLGAPALARERAHLALHLADQVVEALQIDGRLLETALGGAAPIAIEADARRLLEQLAPVVRTIGEQRVDHLAFDDDAGVARRAPCRAADRRCRADGRARD